MSLSISATAPAQPANAPAPAPAATRQAVQPQQAADTVVLSLSAQVIRLNQQGRQPPQIAIDLGIPISAVNSDLAVTTSAGA